MLPLLLLLLPAALAARRAPAGLDAATAHLASRWGPWVVGALTTAVYWWCAGRLTPLPSVHDEASYLFQAQTFALGRWAMPSPPIPEFFEQFHLFVVPTYASKYPPGHALLMVPGIRLGLPILVPMLLQGVAGALVFALARRVANPWVALLTWLLWLTTQDNLYFRSTYFSEATSTALWMGGWWALLEWRRARHPGWLLALAACTAWGAITRPLTFLAYAIPVAIVVVRDVARLGLWRDTLIAVALGSAIVAIMPLWSTQVLGHPRPTPYGLYTDVYFPFDKMGFGTDFSPPRRELPPDMQSFVRVMRPLHARHVPSRLPRILLERIGEVASFATGGWRGILWPFAVAGLVLVGPEALFALGSALLLFVAYLGFAHQKDWVVYYQEATVILPFLTALGLWGLVLLARRDRAAGAMRATAARLVPRGAAAAGLLLAAGVALSRAENVTAARESRLESQARLARIREGVDRMAPGRAIVFVRYAPAHNPHTSFIANDADLAAARVWWVYDRGADNARLLALAPDRTPLLLDEARRAITPLPRVPVATTTRR